MRLMDRTSGVKSPHSLVMAASVSFLTALVGVISSTSRMATPHSAYHSQKNSSFHPLGLTTGSECRSSAFVG
jgi:hypothetical protein